MQLNATAQVHKHDVFISYSRKNVAFASKLEQALESYTPAKDLKVPQRHLDVFRDQQDFTAGEYHQNLDKHLKDSAKLIVVCSPAARKSLYVNDEIRRFARIRGAEHIIPVLFAGIPNNEAKSGQEEERAFPEALCEVMEIPLAANYLGFDVNKDKAHKGTFSDAWYTTLANIYDVSRSELEQREKKRRARTRRITYSVLSGSVAVLSILLVFALVSRSQAEERRKEADRQRQIAEKQTLLAEERARLATARQLAAQATASSEQTSATTAYGTVGPERSVLLALESLKRFQTTEGTKSLRDAMARLTGKVPEIRFKEDDNLGDFSLSPDGKSLGIIQNGKAYLRNVSAQQSADWLIPVKNPLAIIFSPDGTRLAIFCDDSTLIWEVAAQKQIRQLPSIEGTTDTALNSNGSQLIALSEKGLQVWDISSSSVIRQITPPQGSWIKAALSPGGKWLATWDEAGLIQVMEVATGREIGRSENKDIEDLSLSQDGNLLATTSQNGVDVWRVEGWHRIAASLSHEWAVQKMAFSSDGRWLTTVTGQVSMDPAEMSSTSLPGSAIRVWDLNNQRLVMHVSLAQEGGFAQEGGGKGFAFTSNGNRLVTASRIITPSPDGEGSVESKGTKLLAWILLPTDLAETACSLLTRNLSRSEWATFLGDEPYSLTCEGLPVPEE